MEVGAVKQAFNNELILLKKKLNQAKTQIIHKLTRKAKTLTERKAPDQVKEKLKRKAEAAVREVLIMKKIKARDIGRFIVTHTGKLQDYLNKPEVDQNKACARILLHKSMQEKYTFIRNRFSEVPIKDLFMSRQERLKIKKEAREKQKEKEKKKKEKQKKKAANADAEWDVEDIVMSDGKKNRETKYDDSPPVGSDGGSDDENLEKSDEESNENLSSDSDNDVQQDDNDDESNKSSESDVKEEKDKENSDSDDKQAEIGKFVRLTPIMEKASTKKQSPLKKEIKKPFKKDIVQLEKLSLDNSNKIVTNEIPETKIKIIEQEIKKKQEKKQKDNKNKNFNEKILQRKFKKDNNEPIVEGNKVVDPFFITSTGENYMSLAEPRLPDEVKEIHKQGNRKQRRAAMFGHVPKQKARHDEYNSKNNHSNKFNSNNKFENDRNARFNNSEKFNSRDERFNSNFDKNSFKKDHFSQTNNKFEGQNGFKRKKFDDGVSDNRKPSFSNKEARNLKGIKEELKEDKLHPSWEAKKRQSGILPFQGKKIVFDED